MNLWFFVKQVSDFIKFLRLNRSQNSSSLLYPKPLLFTSILKSPMVKRFSYFSIALLRDIFSSSKNIVRLLDSGGLYILKHIHFLSVNLSSQHKHSVYLVSHSLNHTHVSSLRANSIRPSIFFTITRSSDFITLCS